MSQPISGLYRKDEMEKVVFLVQGSAKEPYEVSFQKAENNLTALCNCPAGRFGTYCKHRFKILNGSTEGIVSNNAELVTKVKAWLSGSDIEVALNELAVAEKEMVFLKKRITKLKKELALKMFD